MDVLLDNLTHCQNRVQGISHLVRYSGVCKAHVLFLGLDVIVKYLGGQIKELKSDARLFINTRDILLNLEEPVPGHQF